MLNFRNSKNIFIFFLFIGTGMSCNKSEPACGSQDGLCFSIEKFGENLQTRLAATSLGHSYAIYYDSGLKKWGQGGQARRKQDGNVYDVNAINTNMNVASCAKSMTTIAALKALEQANVSVDAKIKDYLPTWWAIGQNIDLITFKDLLRHRSGFRPTTKAESYTEIRSFVAAGIDPANHGQYQYQNMNFCIFRLLIPILTGDFDKNMRVTDTNADNTTQTKYMQYMADKVWSPLGVSVECENGQNVLYYNYTKPNAAGWDLDNNLCNRAGAAGFYITACELARVMYYARYTDKLLTQAQRDLMFNSAFPLGCFNTNENSAKNWDGQFHHKGVWYDNSDIKIARGLDACWYTFHNKVVVAVATNSFGGLSANGYKDINDLIERAFDDAWISQ